MLAFFPAELWVGTDRLHSMHFRLHTYSSLYTVNINCRRMPEEIPCLMTAMGAAVAEDTAVQLACLHALLAAKAHQSSHAGAG